MLLRLTVSCVQAARSILLIADGTNTAARIAITAITAMVSIMVKPAA